MLKITRDRGAPAGPVTLRLEGRLVHSSVELLREVVGREAPELPLHLDLHGLRFLDEAGVRCLRELLARRSDCSTSSSLFVDALLKGGAA